MMTIKHIAFSGGAIAALAIPLAAQAAEGNGEIVVTAQRREQTITSVPLSIAAASGEQLESKGLEGITDLRFETPGFISLSGTGFTQIYIRGVGNNIFVGADPSVATFIDDVPRVYGSLIDNLINVERVEVLKGAQGGLYGRNATGGVVNILTRQPDSEPAMKANISAGEYQSIDASAYLNMPIGDSVAVNVSGNRRYRHGYVRNLGSNSPYPAGTTSFGRDVNSVARASDLNNADFWAVDGKIRIEASDRVTITLAGDYARKNDADGNGWIQQEPEYNYFIYTIYAGLTGITNPLPPWPAGSIKDQTGYSGIESYSKTEDFGFSAKIVADLGPVELTSITARRWNNGNFRGDIGGGPAPMAGFFTDFDRRNWYQELRFVSTGTGPLRYLGGATYFNGKVDNLLRGLFIGFPTSDTIAFTKTRNWSVYGEVSYDITDRFTVTGSLRYVDEKTTAFFPESAAFPAVTPPAVKQNKLLPSATLTYKVGDGIIYARWARGFKTGGINPIVNPIAFGPFPGSAFGPEVVDTYEAGYRANLLNRTLQLTLAVFYNDFEGVQIARAGNAANPTISNAILNIGGARTYGAEASVVWNITDSVTLSANLGYLNARYKNGAGFVGNLVVDPFDAGGNRMSLSPKWQGGASVNVNHPVNDRFRVKGTVMYSHVGRYNYQYEEYPALFQPAYDVVNVRVGFSDYNERYGVFLFVNNLFDEAYTSFGTKNSLGTLLTPAAPRVIGGTLEVSF